MEFGGYFAPADVARRFTYEYEMSQQPTRGVISTRNLCRHIDDETMMQMVRMFDIRTFTFSEVMQ